MAIRARVAEQPCETTDIERDLARAVHLETW
jgi:hypothetical protein